MAYLLLHSDGQALLATDRPIVKARDRGAIAEANEVLGMVRALEEASSDRCRNAEAEARHLGRLQGIDEGRRDFADAIADIGRQALAHQQAQEDQIATLALAALRRMVDGIGDEAVLIGLARRAVAAVLPAPDILVQVAPDMSDALAAAFAADEDMTGVVVRPDPALAAHQCRITTGDGRIIADLAHQIAAIESRWNGPHAS